MAALKTPAVVPSPSGAPELGNYWTVSDELGLVHSVHSYPASAQATRKWLQAHHPKFYADWAVLKISREQLANIKWLP